MVKLNNFFNYIFRNLTGKMKFELNFGETVIYESFKEIHFKECGSLSPYIKFKCVEHKIQKELKCPICGEIYKF